MYESQIVEVEDMSFGHYIHHFDELDENYLAYDDIYENTKGISDYENEDEQYDEL